MKEFQLVLRNDYDEKLKIDSKTFFSYSPKKFNKMYKSKSEYELLGAVKAKGRNEIGMLALGTEYSLKVFETDDVNKLLYRKVGYAAVAENQYILICKSRIPFLLIFILLLAAVVLVCLWVSSIVRNDDDSSGQPDPPDQGVIDVAPDFPLPENDENLEEVTDNVNSNTTNDNDSSDTVGSASMSYTLSADVSLSDGSIAMMFENPSVSNQAVTLELMIQSNGNSYSIAKSGLLPSGTRLQKMNLELDNISISEGVYTGFYRVSFYNPSTGEKAIVESELTDVKITVKN